MPTLCTDCNRQILKQPRYAPDDMDDERPLCLRCLADRRVAANEREIAASFAKDDRAEAEEHDDYPYHAESRDDDRRHGMGGSIWD